MNTYTLTFTTSRIFYTYGYAFKNLIQKRTSTDTTGQKVDMGDEVHITTPLAIIPNDMIGFYMNPQECALLENRGNARIKHVNVTVVPQGLRTAFDTGTTLSGTATSEHCAIGCYAVGLNQSLYLNGKKYTTDAASPMIPIGVEEVALTSILNKYYGTADFTDSAPMCLGVPRHIDMYCQLRINSNRVVQSYISHDEGVYCLDRYMHRYNFIPKIGDIIIDWNYTPRFGFMCTKAHDIPFIRQQAETIYTHGLYSNVTGTMDVNFTKDGDTRITPTFNKSIAQSANVVSKTLLQYSIGGQKVFAVHRNLGGKVQPAIPLIIFGILPVPQLNPATDATNFQNTAAYFSVKSTMVVEVDNASVFSLGKQAHSANDDIILFPERYANAYDELQVLGLNGYGN